MLAIKQSIGSHHRRNGAARADHGVVRSWIKGEFGRGRCVSTDQEQQQQKLAAQYILNETAAKKHHQPVDRKSVVSGKSVSVRVDIGGRRIIKKTQIKTKIQRQQQ